MNQINDILSLHQPTKIGCQKKKSNGRMVKTKYNGNKVKPKSKEVANAEHSYCANASPPRRAQICSHLSSKLKKTNILNKGCNILTEAPFIYYTSKPKI